MNKLDEMLKKPVSDKVLRMYITSEIDTMNGSELVVGISQRGIRKAIRWLGDYIYCNMPWTYKILCAVKADKLYRRIVR